MWPPGKLSLWPVKLATTYLPEGEEGHSENNYYTGVGHRKVSWKERGPSELIFNLEADQTHTKRLKGGTIDLLGLDIGWSDFEA